MLFISNNCFGATYYSQGSLAPNLTTSWNTNPIGGGSSPSNFLGINIYIVQRGHTMTTTANWTLANGSTLKIGTTGVLQANNIINLGGTASGSSFVDSGTYIHNIATAIKSSIFNVRAVSFITGANFEIRNGSVQIPGTTAFNTQVIYQNLIITNNISITALENFRVNNSLVINSGSQLNMQTYQLGGSFTNTSGTGTFKTQNLSDLGTFSPAVPIGVNWTFDVYYNYSGADQYVIDGTYNNIDASGGSRNLGFDYSGITITGTFTPGSGTYNTDGQGSITFGATGSQTIPALTSSSYFNLFVSNTGKKSLANNVTVAGIISLATVNDSLNLNNHTLTVNGSIDQFGEGYFIGSSSSSLIISGNDNSGLKFDNTGTNGYLNTLTLDYNDASLILNLFSNITVTNLLTIATGVFDLGNFDVTLKSTSIANTALLDRVTGTINYSGSGRFVVERYINNTARGYRNISSGGVMTTDIWSNWQEGATTANYNPKPGYGTQITGKVAGSQGLDVITGIDYTGSGAASLWKYNTSDGYDAILNTKTTALYPYVGYFAIIRGDRSYKFYPATQTLPTAPTTLRARGRAIAGTVTINTSGTNYYFDGGTSLQGDGSFRLNATHGGPSSNYGFTLIGNPYPCMIDWNSIYSNSNNIMNTYWVWDQSTAGGSGSYITVNNLGINTGGGSNAGYIQPGQSFYIQNTSSGTHQLLIQETDKNTGNSNLVAVFGTAQPANSLRINLTKKISNVPQLMDGTVVIFSNNYNNAIDDHDAGKFSNPLENISIYRNRDTISIEQRKLPVATDTLNLRMWNMSASGNYALNIVTSQFSSSLNAYLVDKFLGTQTPLTGDTTKLSFGVTSNANSYLDRFSIIFKPITVLSVSFISVKAYQQQRNNVIEWATADEASDNVLRYEVERSSNGQSFSLIGSATSVNSNGVSNYKWIDAAPLSGDNYYRIKIINRNNSIIKYSSVVVIKSTVTNVKASVYPNPVTSNGLFTVQLNNTEGGTYFISMFNTAGQLVFTKDIQHTGGSSSQQVQLNNNLSKGIYTITIASSKETIFKENIVIK